MENYIYLPVLLILAFCGLSIVLCQLLFANFKFKNQIIRLQDKLTAEEKKNRDNLDRSVI